MKRKIAILLLVGLFAGLNTAFAQSCSLKYGKGKNQVSVRNANTDKNFREDMPMGPMSFRVVGDNIWVLDSNSSRLFMCSSGNEIKQETVIQSKHSNNLFEDFAPHFNKSGALDYFWVADAADFAVVKLSPEGKELVRIGSEEQQIFLQISQLELDSQERLYVSDIGASTLFIFSSDGSLIRKQPFKSFSFAIDKNDNLHVLDYSDKAGYLHRIYSPNGALTRCVEVGLSKLVNHHVWAVSDTGSLFVSFMPESDFDGRLDLIEILPNGTMGKKTKIVPIASMNRFLCISDSRYSLVEADFGAAPAGSFNIKTTSW